MARTRGICSGPCAGAAWTPRTSAPSPPLRRAGSRFGEPSRDARPRDAQRDAGGGDALGRQVVMNNDSRRGLPKVDVLLEHPRLVEQRAAWGPSVVVADPRWGRDFMRAV